MSYHRHKIRSLWAIGLPVSLAAFAPASAEVKTYRYDEQGRLIVTFHREGPATGISVRTTYDAADNRVVHSAQNVVWTLQVGQSRLSADGRFTLIMQAEGNLVLYITGGPALWGSDSIGSGAVRATFQSDGNLVLYNAANQGVWGSGTNNNWGSTAVVQNDGNFVIYNEAGAPIWATNTGGH